MIGLGKIKNPLTVRKIENLKGKRFTRLLVEDLDLEKTKKSGKIQNAYADKTCEAGIKKLMPYGG